MLSENSRKIWKIMIFHRGSGCRHCLDGSLVYTVKNGEFKLLSKVVIMGSKFIRELE